MRSFDGRGLGMRGLRCGRLRLGRLGDRSFHNRRFGSGTFVSGAFRSGVFGKVFSCSGDFGACRSGGCSHAFGSGFFGFALFLFGGFGLGIGGVRRLVGFADFLDDEGIVGEKEDVALMEEPEEVSREFCGRCGAAFGKHGFPEAFELGRLVGANPLHHDGGALCECLAGWQRMRPCGTGEEFSLAFEDR